MNDGDYIYDGDDILNKLEALAMFWDVAISGIGNGKVTLNLSLDGDQVTQFSGKLSTVIMQADTWFDNAEFSFVQAKAVQP